MKTFELQGEFLFDPVTRRLTLPGAIGLQWPTDVVEQLREQQRFVPDRYPGSLPPKVVIERLQNGHDVSSLDISVNDRTPGVREALVERVRACDVESLQSLARALGNIGGPGAAEVLQQRLEQIDAAQAESSDDAFQTEIARRAVAHALLRLSPDSPAASSVLIDHVGREDGFLATSALNISSDLLRTTMFQSAPRTNAYVDLRKAIEELRYTHNVDLFVAAIPALLSRKLRAETLLRCADLLGEPDPTVRQKVANTLARLVEQHVYDDTPRRIMNRWLEQESDFDLLLWFARFPYASERIIASAAERGLASEAPYYRSLALRNLHDVSDSDRVNQILTEACAREPDPFERITNFDILLNHARYPFVFEHLAANAAERGLQAHAPSHRANALRNLHDLPDKHRVQRMLEAARASEIDPYLLEAIDRMLGSLS